MSTTALFIELLLTGLQAALWLILLILSVHYQNASQNPFKHPRWPPNFRCHIFNRLNDLF